MAINTRTLVRRRPLHDCSCPRVQNVIPCNPVHLLQMPCWWRICAGTQGPFQAADTFPLC